jgi:hypothetical protein
MLNIPNTWDVIWLMLDRNPTRSTSGAVLTRRKIIDLLIAISEALTSSSELVLLVWRTSPERVPPKGPHPKDELTAASASAKAAYIVSNEAENCMKKILMRRTNELTTNPMNVRTVSFPSLLQLDDLERRMI